MKEDRRTRYTKMMLRDSLMQWMKQKPISKITIKELCETADINRTTFYSHYCDQYALLREIENETLMWVGEAAGGIMTHTDPQDIMKILESIFEKVIDNAKYLQVLLSEQGNIAFQKELFSLIYRSCSASAEGVNLLIRENYLVYAVNGSVGLVQHWLKTGLKQSARDMAEILYHLISWSL